MAHQVIRASIHAEAKKKEEKKTSEFKITTPSRERGSKKIKVDPISQSEVLLMYIDDCISLVR